MNRKTIGRKLKGHLMKQLPEFKYLGCVPSEDSIFDKEFENRRMNGNKVMALPKSHLLKTLDLKKETKLILHRLISRISMQTRATLTLIIELMKSNWLI